MERAPIRKPQKSTFKCEQCGVYNKIGAGACWKCGKVFRVAKASDSLPAPRLRMLNEERVKPKERRLRLAASLLLLILPPAGIGLTWLPAIKWRIPAKAALSVLSALWCAFFLWNMLTETPMLDISALLSLRPPVTTDAPNLTGLNTPIDNNKSEGRSINSQPLNLNDAVRIYLNEALGGKTEKGLNRVVGVNNMHTTINADGDVNNPDYASLREQALKAIAAVAPVYERFGATNDCRILLYLVGENANNEPYERCALTIAVDADTMTNTDWNAVTPDTLEDFAAEYDEDK